MSIIDLVVEKIRLNALFLLEPQAKGETWRRTLLMTEEIHGALFSPEGDLAWETRVGELRADLETFVINETIDPKYLFLLYPAQKGVWEIRSTRGKPSIRVLGLFIQRDVFLATNMALREHLGGWESREWKQVKRRAQARWRNLLQNYPPLSEIDAKQVITGALNGKYFKTFP